MKNQKKNLWKALLTALFLAVIIVGCRDEDESIIGICPEIVSTNPENTETDIPVNQVISATFNEAMDPASIGSATFNLFEYNPENDAMSDNIESGTVSYDESTYTINFEPTEPLKGNTKYIAIIEPTVKDLMGNYLQAPYEWTFSTIELLVPQSINLNSLTEYGIIAGVGVSNNAGPSEIHDMNVGLYPGERSSITGFFDVDGGPGLIFNGSFHAADDLVPAGINADLNQAKLDLVQAYNRAAEATSPAPSVAPADLGGKTLAPGIYSSESTLLLQNGDLTLDAQGDENAVWIFQVGSGFTSIGGAGGNVILAGGAKAKNIFWQVGSSAVIGDYTVFKGNILAFSDITMNSGAVAEGRLLARNGSVILTNTNIITRPSN